MPTTVINEFTIEPKAAPPTPGEQPGAGGGGASAKGDGGKGSPETAREIERVLRHHRHRAMRLWAY